MKTILFIDDETYINQPVVDALLETDDYEVIFKNSVIEGKNTFIEKIDVIDIVLLDIMMGISEKDILEEKDILKKTDSGFSAGIYLYEQFLMILKEKNKKIPIIIFTARYNILNDFKNLDSTNVLIKPVNFEKLTSLINKKLDDE